MNGLDSARRIIEQCDEQICACFEKRMAAAKEIAAYKLENGLPVFDAGREKALTEKNTARLENSEILPYYKKLFESILSVSKQYQTELINARGGKKITVFAGEKPYDIITGRGLLARAGEFLNLERKVLVVTDSGVPERYARTVAAQCGEGFVFTVPEGEDSKSVEMWQRLLEFMLEHGFSRKDCVIAVGGGVPGDLAGFAASAYMRGIEFYNIPTTVLSQVDSSIGGKTAVNAGKIKNIIGAFYQPSAVLADIDTLETLPARQLSNGLAEAVKAAVIADRELFDIFENGSVEQNLELIIRRSLLFKKAVVEQDEKEQGQRKILNFGHTIGHGIESSRSHNGLYHGECVALGMIPMCAPDVRQRLIPVLGKLNMPTELDFDPAEFAAAVTHDKKGAAGSVDAVICNEIGTCEIKRMTFDEITALAGVLRKS